MSRFDLVRAAIRKYNRLCVSIEKTRSDVEQCGFVQDLSGSFIEKRKHDFIVEHLRNSLDLDVEDDAIRLLLAYEYWRCGRETEALKEYQIIVQRDNMQSVIAAQMISEIKKNRSS